MTSLGLVIPLIVALTMLGLAVLYAPESRQKHVLAVLELAVRAIRAWRRR